MHMYACLDHGKPGKSRNDCIISISRPGKSLVEFKLGSWKVMENQYAF